MSKCSNIIGKVLLGIALLFAEQSRGQVSNYVFTSPTSTYTSISSGTTASLSPDSDEGLSVAIPIGFTFVYDGVSYTQAIISSNGWLSFNTALTDPTFSNTLTNSNAIRPALYPLWDDMDMFSGYTKYLTSGTTGSRIFTVEWNNVYWDWNAANTSVSFEIKLYEGTNIVQFVYKQEVGAVESFSSGATIGISGVSSGDYLTLNSPSASPTASSSTFTTNISSRPATGQVYQFAPPACSGTPTGGTTSSTANNVCTGTSITLSVTGATSGYSGLTYQWQSSADGISWSNIGSATSSSYTTSISSSTYFRRTITCSGSSSNSSSLLVTVQTPTISVSPSSVCVNSSATLGSSASVGATTLLSENFNGASNSWTTINNSTGGSSSSSAAWTLRPDGYFYNGTSSFTFHSNDNSQFYLTNADAAGSGVTVQTILQSPAFSTTGYSSCTLKFYHHYNYFTSGESAKVEISTNGSTWTNLQTYTSDQGTESSFVLATIDLTSYINNATVYIRFKYDAAWDWFWAIDNVTITGTPVAATYAWTASPSTGAGLPAGAGSYSSANNSVIVTPTIPGTFSYSVNTNNSCLATTSVTVTAAANGPGTGGLVSSSICKTQSVSSGDNYFVDNTNCNMMAFVKSQGVNPVSGSTKVCLTFDGTVQFHYGQPYLQRHYDIEPSVSPNNSTARITLYATQAEFNAVNAADLAVGNNWPDFPTGPSDATGIASVHVTQWHGTATTTPSSPGNYTSTTQQILNPVSVTWNSTYSRWEIVVDINGFSGFYIHTGYGYALSSNFINFSGRRQDNNNWLTWKIGNEQNTRGYSVERSDDGQHFTEIGFVNSSSPGGNSNDVLQYTFTDNNFIRDKQYYRLKQIDQGGRAVLSSVVVIKNNSLLTIDSVFPNPANDFINLSISSPKREHAKMSLLDITGRIMSIKTIIIEAGQNTIPINIETLNSGVYIIKLQYETGGVGITRFVKQ